MEVLVVVEVVKDFVGVDILEMGLEVVDVLAEVVALVMVEDEAVVELAVAVVEVVVWEMASVEVAVVWEMALV